MAEVAAQASVPGVPQRGEVNVGNRAKGKINHGFARIFTDQVEAENHEQPLLAAITFEKNNIVIHNYNTKSRVICLL
jgi:hypothetical protein